MNRFCLAPAQKGNHRTDIVQAISIFGKTAIAMTFKEFNLGLVLAYA